MRPDLILVAAETGIAYSATSCEIVPGTDSASSGANARLSSMYLLNLV